MSHPRADWLDACVSYKAKKEIAEYLDSLPKPRYHLCGICNPIPGEEIVGFKADDDDDDQTVTLHKRDCKRGYKPRIAERNNIVAV